MAAPIEQQLSGLDGLLYYKSSNSSNGVMNLQVYFDIGRDQDLAAVDVQNAIKVAEPQLPEEVRRQGVVIKKAQTDILLVASLTSNDPRYDADLSGQLRQAVRRGRAQAAQRASATPASSAASTSR